MLARPQTKEVLTRQVLAGVAHDVVAAALETALGECQEGGGSSHDGGSGECEAVAVASISALRVATGVGVANTFPVLHEEGGDERRGAYPTVSASPDQQWLTSLYSHAAVAHFLTVVVDFCIMVQTKLVLKREMSFYMMVIHCASTATYLVGSQLGGASVDYSLPLRSLEWSITVPSLVLVIGGMSFEADPDLIWDASLLAMLMITSGSLAWWYYWPWLDPSTGVPADLGLDLGRLGLDFAAPLLERLGLGRWLLAAGKGPSWAALARCGALTAVTTFTYGWLMMLVVNFLLYSELVAQRSGILGKETVRRRRRGENGR